MGNSRSGCGRAYPLLVSKLCADETGRYPKSWDWPEQPSPKVAGHRSFRESLLGKEIVTLWLARRSLRGQMGGQDPDAATFAGNEAFYRFS